MPSGRLHAHVPATNRRLLRSNDDARESRAQKQETEAKAIRTTRIDRQAERNPLVIDGWL